MALFRVANNRAQFDAASNDARDQYGAGIRFTQGGNARVTTSAGTFYNQGISMSGTGQVAIVDATAGLPSGTVFHNGLPMSGDKVCVSRNATAVVANGLPFDSAGALAADINFDLNFIGTDTLNSSVTFTRASTATFFNSSGVLTSAGNNVARFDYNPSTLAALGLLIEEQRTNSIRNNTMQGAVAGTPGTLPTNWVTGGLGTLTYEVVATGTDSGVNYVDYRLSGTTSTTNTILLFDATTQIVAATGQTWASSFFIKLQAGSTANITSVANEIRGYTSGGTIQEQNSASITLSGTLTRNTHVFTLANANSVRVANNIRVNFASGVAIDITLRIGLPQLEQGAFATSVIPTTTTALTRNADVANVNTLAPWYNATEGTLFVQAQDMSDAPHATSQPRAASINNGTSSSTIDISRLPASAQGRARVDDTGVNQFNSLNSAWPLATQAKIALAYKANDFAACLGGGTVFTDNTGTIPTVSALTIGNVTAGGVNSWVGWIQRVAYYPRRLSNAELQAITV